MTVSPLWHMIHTKNSAIFDEYASMICTYAFSRNNYPIRNCTVHWWEPLQVSQIPITGLAHNFYVYHIFGTLTWLLCTGYFTPREQSQSKFQKKNLHDKSFVEEFL